MKEPWEWTEEDLVRHVADGVQESLTLDYKQSAALEPRKPTRKADLSKDVSSFANSAGGTLVYGVVEKNHLPTHIDKGLDPYGVTREWLEQVINSTIQRRVPGVRINQVQLHAGSPGRVAYVVHVPQSQDAPHMASDHRYYKRFNYESAPMEDYEVRDVSNRSDGPELYLDVQLVDGKEILLVPSENSERSEDFKVRLSIANRASQVAEHRILRTFTDSRLGASAGGKEAMVAIGDLRLTCRHWSQNQSPLNSMPIWEGVPFMVKELILSVPTVDADADYLLIWQVDAPKMTTTEGYAVIRARQRKLAIENIEEPPASLRGFTQAS